MEGAGVVVIEMPSIVLPENMYNLSYNSIGDLPLRMHTRTHAHTHTNMLDIYHRIIISYLVEECTVGFKLNSVCIQSAC